MRLIEQAWYQNHWLRWLLLPLSLLFWVLSSLRKWAYASGLKKSFNAGVPVIIVGNIGVGGNGKTPVVIYLVKLLQQMGITVGVTSRGYGGNAESYPLTVEADTRAEQAGDEPVLIYQRCQVATVIGPDRVANCQRLVEQGCQVIISDDGLQHYRLQRTLEIVIIDGQRRFGNGWLLPAGPLRELPSRLKQVDAVICNGAEAQGDELQLTLQPGHLVHVASGKTLSVDEFQQAHGKQAQALAGIGNPQRFFDTLAALDFQLHNPLGFVDHHKFIATDFEQFSSQQPLLMTEKDAVKCREFCPQNAWYLPVDGVLNEADAQHLTQLINTRVLN
ncbi:tetraacyldisaccharide 4'-kinase [Thalassotalea mangrovi]|uniref:Tetraacyldisaccharide 4'-kinase n=1 Tax=Thalassotalea mangrovi TaxID=2572245 RepID=A0A4U1B3Z6_9GAMM|nr:tetraacyldisaccharide 4'-kinase [Thalassotalea mangrovi]TKB44119.1 tetraacyldisaccharide 4'-kinase [Thalassotalea mangrovi]